MESSAIRSRLAGSEGRLFWRSLGELADTPQFREYLHREFPEQASQFNDPKGRREFLKLMSASLALAGVTGCVKQPLEQIVPYVRQPENMVPGRPLFFATAIPFGGVAVPALVESHEGHPTKVEGNPQHPASLGGSDVFAQAAILNLYDPDRLQTVHYRGEVRSWSDFTSAIKRALDSQKAKGGAGLRFLSETLTSPTIAEQITLVQQAFPQAKFHQWDPTARPADTTAPLYDFTKADIVVTLDADFLGCGAAAIKYSRDFATRRRAGADAEAPAAPAAGTNDAAAETTMNRLYAIESTPTLTGAKADHRLALKASEIAAAAQALSTGSLAGSLSNGNAQKFIAAAAKDLQAHRGRSVVIAGDYQPAAVHQLARQMNEALGNVGATVTYVPAIAINPTDHAASLRDLVNAMDAGQVDLLVMLGVNPVFTAPADFKFLEKLGKVGTTVTLSLWPDETAFNSQWNVPEAHPLESWADARAFDGTVTVMQPLIAPLYDGKTISEVLGVFIDAQGGKSAHDLVKDYWTRALAGGAGSWQITDPTGSPFKSPESMWKHVLHDGWITGTAAAGAGDGARRTEGGNVADYAAIASTSAPAAATTPEPSSAPPPPPSAPASGLEIIFRPDPTIWDGRFANNGWLQELPKPLTKITWDPSAWISKKLADEKGLKDGDLIELRYKGNTAKLPVAIVPAHPDQSVTVFYGYGRERTGRVGTVADKAARDFNVYKLRTSDALYFDGGLEISKAGKYLLARTQEHHLMEGRAPVRIADVEEYRKDPEVVAKQGEAPPKTLTLIPEWDYSGHYKWGMQIDLTSCTGCSTCTIACQSENNIPVVGKEQVDKGREMHWIRVDHYFEGNPDDGNSIRTYHQPVPCQQCENAPCELVCPVGATVHSAEGLNDMVYNRCVGTRYCSNNCPYKVRRFNFLLYQDWNTPQFKLQRNPDVTVRSRGVMEKCTYCVQRINAARIQAKREDRDIRDGEVVTACQAVCPTDAIVFGNINDPNSRVVKLKQSPRNYSMLEDLNTRPRTTYLAAVKNPNPSLPQNPMVGGHDEATNEGGGH
jgi:molybdopterin-containing oxidoreductase family iron-sulfur binding subunit